VLHVGRGRDGLGGGGASQAKYCKVEYVAQSKIRMSAEVE
jgi:hypothetical protein